MTLLNRQLKLESTLKNNSAFLFGPRGTGKSTLVQQQFPEACLYDLLEEKTYLRLMRDSSILEQENLNSKKLIVIDEVQKLPKLLDEVHRLIVKYKHRFLLTGSSARKLKRSGVNLLGGRARELHLFPLTSHELPNFDLLRYLNRGGLPNIHFSEEPMEDLKDYVSLYLREEIAAEALTRRVDQFARFLDIIALHCGEELHFQNFSSDSGVPVGTLQNYVEILEDTLVGFRLYPFESTLKRKAITRSKFYLFDIGVTRSLAKRGNVEFRGDLFERAFEQFVVLECRAALDYHRIDAPLQYWRTKTGFEVDLILGGSTAIEIKGTDWVSEKHLKGLKALREEKLLRNYWIVSLESKGRIIDGIEIIPWQQFLHRLWGAQIKGL